MALRGLRFLGFLFPQCCGTEVNCLSVVTYLHRQTNANVYVYTVGPLSMGPALVGSATADKNIQKKLDKAANVHDVARPTAGLFRTCTDFFLSLSPKQSSVTDVSTACAL